MVCQAENNSCEHSKIALFTGSTELQDYGLQSVAGRAQSGQGSPRESTLLSH